MPPYSRFYRNGFGKVQRHGAEVPDCPYPRVHQRVRSLLRLRRRQRQHREFHVQLPHRAREFLGGEYLLSVYLRPHESGVHVETRDYVQPVFLETAVTQQGLSEFPRADQHRVLFVVVAHKALDVAYEVGDVVAHFGFAFAHHRHRKVLLHDGGIFLHCVRKPDG